MTRSRLVRVGPTDLQDPAKRVLDMGALDRLPGEDFEKSLVRLLSGQGFTNVALTPRTEDFGADFLADRHGRRYVIQAKRSISACGISAVQQVIGARYYYAAEAALVVTNSHFTNSAVELAKRASVELVDRKQLKAWIASAKLAPLTGAPSPRPYQTDGLKELGKIRSEGGSRALVVMASGLGKTHLAAFDVRAFQAETGKPTRVLYLSHQSVILDQARRTFGNVFGTARSYGRFDGEAHEPQADFVFGSFQSVYDSLDLFEPTSFDYVIVDEAHHTAAPTRDAVVSHVRPQFMLGLTATPFRGDGKDIYTYYNDTVAVSLPVEKAIVQGLLAPIEYRMISDIADPNALNLALRSAGKIKAGKLFKPKSDSEIVTLVQKSAAQLAQAPKILVFCASLKQMQHFAEVFDDSRTISGIDDRKTQISVVEDFREGRFTTLLSRDVLNEGIDVPDANCLVFLRNTESPVVFLQQLGRGLRKAEGKDRVLVLDFVSNLDRFEFVYSFLSHLRAEQEARERTEREYQPPGSILHLDQTARDVIAELVTKREQKGFITELSSLVAAFSYKVSVQTLQHLVELGKLIPDFVLADETGRERRYFEKATVERLLRQSASVRHLEGLIPERIAAKRLGVTVGWLKHQEKIGNVRPSWIHRRIDGRIEFYFSTNDLEGARTVVARYLAKT